MTRINSEMPIDALLKTLFKYQELQRLALRREDIRAANRHVLKAFAAADALNATPQGRDVLERLLNDTDPFLRLRAAECIMKWDPDLAIPVLGRMLFEDLGNESSPDERINIRTTAKDWLYRHFNIRSFDRNDLIEPLKAYGVELPYRDYGKWQ